ncbi:NB-ARC domain-containing protein [Streptomyces sp. NBC_01244]|uniref:NB-ARC domain-containing protein n=1 Tax=Streptomyces sp. NBC_01244 TaxID=2903797 RepID=UPI002E13D008|nr:NB-ARC domain-containing protein [Streptomyces sp. NBC_01244]
MRGAFGGAVKGVLLAGGSAVLAVLISLAVNQATERPEWGRVDWLRRYPWWWVGGLTAVVVLLAGVAAWRQERPAVVAGDPPPPPRVPVPDWVVDRGEARQAVAAVRVPHQGSGTAAVGITTSLEGAGGFGKTTLAGVVAADGKVRRHFKGRVYTVTIGRDVRGRSAIAAKVAEVTRFVTGDSETYEDPQRAGEHLGRLLELRPRTLLVLDDVWEAEQLAPFLLGGRNCVRLVTTRVAGLLPEGSVRLRVDEMSPEQARTLLTQGLPALPAETFEGLLRATGRWALLLRLTNRLIAGQVATGADPAAAAAEALRVLREGGPAAVDALAPGAPVQPLDLNDPVRRAQAVRATVEAATGLLPPDGARRLAELGVFVEDEAIPVPLVVRLWAATGGLTEAQSRNLCGQLHQLSLVSLEPADGGRLGLHDVFRDYLRDELGVDEVGRLHQVLVDAALPPGAHAWELTDGYLLDHLVRHLLSCGPAERALEIAGDLRWVERRLRQRGPAGPWSDLARIPGPEAAPLARDLNRLAHLVGPVEPAGALRNILYDRLGHLPHWGAQVQRLQSGAEPAVRPALLARLPQPDLPDPALLRTLTGHGAHVASLEISADGATLTSTDATGERRAWDRDSGTRLPDTGSARGTGPFATHATDTWSASTYGGSPGSVYIHDVPGGATRTALPGHVGNIGALAVAPDGSWLAAAGEDHLIRLWDAATWTCRAVLQGHTSPVEAIGAAPDSSFLVSSCQNGDLWWWQATTPFTPRVITTAAGRVHVIAVAPDGSWFADGGEQGVVRFFDLASTRCTAVLWAHVGEIRALAIAPDGSWVASGGADGAIRLWETAAARNEPPNDRWTYPVAGVATSPDGTLLASVGHDATVRIWATESGAPVHTHGGEHGMATCAVVWDPAGSWVATASANGIVVVREVATGRVLDRGEFPSATALAVSPDGVWLAVAGEDNAVRLWNRATGSTSTQSFIRPVRRPVFVPDAAPLLADHGQDLADWVGNNPGTSLQAALAGPVDTLAFSPDGQWLATAGADAVLRIWARGAQEAATAVRTEAPVRSLAWTPDGRTLAVGGERGLYVYDFRP